MRNDEYREFVAEGLRYKGNVGEMSEQAARIFPGDHELANISGALQGMADRIEIPDAPVPAHAKIHHDDKPRPARAKGGAEHVVGVAEGKDMILSFDTAKCVHARQCVLSAPQVFLSGVEGQWLSGRRRHGDQLYHHAGRYHDAG